MEAMPRRTWRPTNAATAAAASLLSGFMVFAVGPDAPIGVVKLPPMLGVVGVVEPGEEVLVPAPVPEPVAVPVLVPAALYNRRQHTQFIMQGLVPRLFF